MSYLTARIHPAFRVIVSKILVLGLYSNTKKFGTGDLNHSLLLYIYWSLFQEHISSTVTSEFFRIFSLMCFLALINIIPKHEPLTAYCTCKFGED